MKKRIILFYCLLSLFPRYPTVHGEGGTVYDEASMYDLRPAVTHENSLLSKARTGDSFARFYFHKIDFVFDNGPIGGMAHPERLLKSLYFLREQCNTRAVITLTEAPLNTTLTEPHQDQVTFHHFPIENLTYPEPSTIPNFLKIVNEHEENSERVIIHCEGGMERTGTMLAIWLLYNTKAPTQDIIRYINVNRHLLPDNHALEPCQHLFITALGEIVRNNASPEGALAAAQALREAEYADKEISLNGFFEDLVAMYEVHHEQLV